MKKVWVNGCFDVLHYGHFQLLKYASSFGEVIVGIDSDKRVRKLKGKDRPFHTEKQRKSNLHRIKGIRKVKIFDTEKELIWNIENEKPDIMVIGEEYKNKKIIGEELIPEIKFFEKLDGFSTTRLLNE